MVEFAGLGERKVTVVLPAYNAGRTLRDTYARILGQPVDEIILVDDASRDDTFDQAKELGIISIRHRHNLGYGGNQKTCYNEALQRNADIVVMIHPDGQYDPAFLRSIIEPIVQGKADVVLGSRMFYRNQARRGGMPLYKIVSNIALTALENFVLRQNLSEYHTGYRAYRSLRGRRTGIGRIKIEDRTCHEPIEPISQNRAC